MQILPKPEITRCFFDKSFQPALPAMVLRWDPEAPGVMDRVWHLPGSVSFKGPAPERFGITIHRVDDDGYHVRVLWNQLCLSWESITRRQILTSSLALMLESLGTDLWHVLNQPIESDPRAVLVA